MARQSGWPVGSCRIQSSYDSLSSRLSSRHEYSESDPELSAQIKRYWQDLGFDFPGVKTAWSAVFVSWCVKKAGATGKEFAFAAAHAKFVKAAIQNALKAVGVFRGLQIDQYAPKVGDIVQNNRSGNKFTYDFARTHSAYESHSAIVVEVGLDHDGHYLMTIGGTRVILFAESGSV
jgi:hypothetical protein